MIISIKVVPSSGRQQLTLDKSGNFKCYLKNAPENNKANDELIRFFANTLKISPDLISIMTGKTSRQKLLKINKELTTEDILKAFEVEKQYALL